MSTIATDPTTTEAPQTKPRRRNVKPATDTPVKRAGRPAAPQTVTEAMDAFRTKVQAARKALNDALNLLDRMADINEDIAVVSEDDAVVNWRGRVEILHQLKAIDYDLHAAQLVIASTTYAKPTDKI